MREGWGAGSLAAVLCRMPAQGSQTDSLWPISELYRYLLAEILSQHSVAAKRKMLGCSASARYNRINVVPCLSPTGLLSVVKTSCAVGESWSSGTSLKDNACP